MRISSHRKALETIAANPQKFGFDNIIAVAIEVNLRDERGRLIAQPDIVLYDRKDVYIIEYKSNGDPKLIEKARRQLHNAAAWFSKYTSIVPKTKMIDGTQYFELRKIR